MVNKLDILPTILNRTFHPVGQGSFYSENFEWHGRCFTMVYDCGATNTNTPPESLCKDVRQSFHEDRYDEQGRLKVDILFLSHFHNDHLNGVSLLAPKIVVCPFISDEDILMLQVLNHFQSEWNIEAMRNPAILFDNGTRIIQVDLMDQEPSFEGSNRILSVNDLPSSIPSGSRIGLRSAGVNLSYKWCFIPYNFHYRERIDEFKRLLSDGIPGKFPGGLAFEDLESNPAEFILKNRKVLRQICDTFTGRTNDQSLLLYSGPADIALEMEYVGNSTVYDEELRDYWYDSAVVRNMLRCFPEIYHSRFIFKLGFKQRNNRPAIIYYGDITLREQLVRSLTSGLNVKMKNVGTIQLPHHGSDRSFHVSVLSYYRFWDRLEYPEHSILYIMSAGSKSKTHPGKTVISKLSHSKQAYTVVKENRLTALTECWSLRHANN